MTKEKEKKKEEVKEEPKEEQKKEEQKPKEENKQKKQRKERKKDEVLVGTPADPKETRSFLYSKRDEIIQKLTSNEVVKILARGRARGFAQDAVLMAIRQCDDPLSIFKAELGDVKLFEIKQQKGDRTFYITCQDIVLKRVKT